MAVNGNHDAVKLSTTPQRIRRDNLTRIGLIVQNRHATANIYLRSGGDGNPDSYLEFKPMGDFHENIMPPTQEIWAYSDTDGAVLTIVEKFGA